MSAAVTRTNVLPEVSSRPRTANLLRFASRKPVGAISLAIILVMVFMAAFAEAIAPFDPLAQDYDSIMQPPTALHLFGTDNLGRDLLSRIIHGSRISLQIGIAAMIISTGFGAVIALISGFAGGKLDLLVQRIMDAWMAFPLIIFALTVLAALGPGLSQTIIAVGVVGIPSTSRVIRGSVLAEKQNMYVEAARAIGASQFRQMFIHVLPNVAAPILVIATLRLAQAILTEASLSFLGLGVPPPAPAWGSMLSGHSRTYMLAAPWMAVWPGVAISLAVLSWNLLGDALRDIWDPRQKGT